MCSHQAVLPNVSHVFRFEFLLGRGPGQPKSSHNKFSEERFFCVWVGSQGHDAGGLHRIISPLPPSIPWLHHTTTLGFIDLPGFWIFTGHTCQVGPVRVPLSS